ncbi:MAG TPA: dodecin family protein [Egibacteraceae bacterium]|jgi:dodecin|nr:dodecin family protein [Egibacteraceae bacterium]
MAVARVTEITSTSPTSFEDAIQKGLERATQTLRNIEGAWVKEMEVRMRDNEITDYKVNLKVTFVLEDPS